MLNLTIKQCRKPFFLVILSLFLAGPAAAFEDINDGAKAMLTTAHASGDKAVFDLVLETALATWPDARADILKFVSEMQADWLDQDSKEELAVAVAEAERKAAEAKRIEAEDKARGLAYIFDPKLWNSQAELGAGVASGDSDDKSIALALRFNRAFGPDWEHDLDIDIDFARRAGETSKKRAQADYELLWRPWDEGYLLSFTRLEHDKLSGYTMRVVENIGIGYEIISSDTQSLRVEGGPGLRYTKFTATQDSEVETLARVSASYSLKLSDNVSFSDTASALFGAASTTLENKAEVSSRFSDQLAAKFGIEVKYDSNAPEFTSAWDTNSRVSFIYDF